MLFQSLLNQTQVNLMPVSWQRGFGDHDVFETLIKPGISAFNGGDLTEQNFGFVDFDPVFNADGGRRVGPKSRCRCYKEYQRQDKQQVTTGWL
jgi:hypothetical protein